MIVRTLISPSIRAGKDAPLPKLIDFSTSDIDDSDLVAISKYFGIIRLRQDTKIYASFPLNGRLFGPLGRIFFPMVLSRKDRNITVPMLYDTGSSFTFLRKDTLRALGVAGDIPVGALTCIHGLQNVVVYESHGRFSNVDIIGQKFLHEAKLEIRVAPHLFRAVLLPVTSVDYGADDI
jgi:hypothetical protein